MSYEFIKNFDTELYDAMENELRRQRDHIELIASENFTSRAVMQAMGSHLTNKYAEGYHYRHNAVQSCRSAHFPKLQDLYLLQV